jgi:hypothetical protein
VSSQGSLVDWRGTPAGCGTVHGNRT